MTDYEFNRMQFAKFTKQDSVNPRFDLADCTYKVKSNPAYMFVPDLNVTISPDFETITDNRALSIKPLISNRDKVYLWYSGGIDSTLVLCSLLKNWSHVELQKLTLIMSKTSIDENPTMYHTHIENKLATVDATDYLFHRKLVGNDIHISGDCGDTIMGYDNLDHFDMCYPGSYNKAWRTNQHILIDFFALYSNRTNAKWVVDYVASSINKHMSRIETISDFLWWTTFNWAHNADIFVSVRYYARLSPECDTRTFFEENLIPWFNTIEYQEWAISSVGTDLRIREDYSTNKYAAKKYIHDFNGDDFYFRNKLPESSLVKNKEFFPKLVVLGVDTEYNIYYRDTRVDKYIKG